jgi:hypothetical protein
MAASKWSHRPNLYSPDIENVLKEPTDIESCMDTGLTCYHSPDYRSYRYLLLCSPSANVNSKRSNWSQTNQHVTDFQRFALISMITVRELAKWNSDYYRSVITSCICHKAISGETVEIFHIIINRQSVKQLTQSTVSADIPELTERTGAVGHISGAYTFNKIIISLIT